MKDVPGILLFQVSKNPRGKSEYGGAVGGGGYQAEWNLLLCGASTGSCCLPGPPS